MLHTLNVRLHPDELAPIINEAALNHNFTNEGVASWYDFAIAIRDEAREIGHIRTGECRIEQTTTIARPSPAPRPHYSVLDKTSTWAFLGHKAPHWRGQLNRMIRELKE